jgi:hypothetical protein
LASTSASTILGRFERNAASIAAPLFGRQQADANIALLQKSVASKAQGNFAPASSILW